MSESMNGTWGGVEKSKKFQFRRTASGDIESLIVIKDKDLVGT